MLKHLLFFLILPFLVLAQSPVKPVNYVTDEAGVLSKQEQQVVNRKLRAFEDSTSNQIFVYVASSLKGREMTDLCQELFTKWKIGKAGKDNGLLIAVFINDHQFRIHTGYGLEGNLPDELTKRIQEEDMRPWFKTKEYYKGLNAGIDKLIYYSTHEYAAEAPQSATNPGAEPTPEYVPQHKNGDLIFIGIFALFCYIINGGFLWAVRSSIKSNEKKSEKAKKVALTLSTIFFFIPFLGAFLLGILGIIYGKGGRGGRGGSSWSSSSSSSSSSSFGGGGGGRSGGGGSSSSW